YRKGWVTPLQILKAIMGTQGRRVGKPVRALLDFDSFGEDQLCIDFCFWVVNCARPVEVLDRECCLKGTSLASVPEHFLGCFEMSTENLKLLQKGHAGV